MKKLFSLMILALAISFMSPLEAQVNFSEAYISKMQNCVTYEIPEVQELVHIMIALTPFGKTSRELVEKNTAYYQEVMAYFGKYAQEKIIKKFDKDLRKNRYACLKMDACGFYFDENNQIIKDQTYASLSWDAKNWIEAYTADIQSFANLSSFRTFFKNHQSFYEKQISLLDQQLDVKNQWKWLETKFDNEYQSYRVTFSPLVNGYHSTNRFTQGDFKQMVMFICGPYQTDKYSEELLKGLMGRIIFTEIDHNYVNPLSDQYKLEINKLFKDVKDWNSFKYPDYPTPYLTFNEYMTYAFYSLYVLDNFKKEEADFIIERAEKLMLNRGFIKYPEFNQTIIKMYQEHRDIKPKEMYEQLFEVL